jgi:hypothetical protein
VADTSNADRAKILTAQRGLGIVKAASLMNNYPYKPMIERHIVYFVLVLFYHHIGAIEG